MSTAASTVRHALGAGLEALLLVALVMILAFGSTVVNGHPAGATSVLAAKGGNGNGGANGNGGGLASGTSSSITLDQAEITLSLGTPVTFTTSVDGLTGNEYALVYLKCTEGDAIVYGQLDLPGTTFVLGGGSSPWWLIGGTATCVGYLEAYGTHGGYDTARVLAQTAPFTAN